MTKRRNKAYPPAPPATPSGLQTNADQRSDPNPALPPFATDPLDAYDELKQDVFCRRELVWQIAHQSEDAQSIASAMVGVIVSKEIIITSAKPENQQTRVDKDDANKFMHVINSAMGRTGGYLEFVKAYAEGFLFGVTGAFPTIVLDNYGDISEIGVIDPLSPRPYYKDGTAIYYTQDGVAQAGGYMQPSGIWYKGPGGFYTTLPSTLYYQATYGALGRGAWIVGRPLAEENLQILTLGTALRQFIRKSIYGLDSSQVLVMNFVDKEAFFEQLKQRKENMKKRPQERGNVLAITQNNPDREASVKSVNMRGLPEGIDMIEFLDLVAASTAKGFGIKAARIATTSDKARYAGSGAQAAQQESDEWGISLLQASLINFYNNFLLAGKPFIAKFVGTDDPKSYARAAYEGQVAQTASQLAPLYAGQEDLLRQFLVERGVMAPSTIGAIAVTQSGVKATSEDDDEVDRNVEACSQNLNELWANFVANDLPETVDRYGIDESKLNDELYYLSQLLVAQAIRCIRDAAGGVRDAYIRNLENQARIGLINLTGRPKDWTDVNRPRFPAYSEIMNFSPMLAVGTATLADLQNRMLRFAGYVRAYANLSRQANWYAAGVKNGGGPVTWVRTAAESCPDCVMFEGTYPSMDALLTRTNGRLPGSPALQDKGHCKCYLIFGA